MNFINNNIWYKKNNQRKNIPKLLQKYIFLITLINES